jgi:hypothetical protein
MEKYVDYVVIGQQNKQRYDKSQPGKTDDFLDPPAYGRALDLLDN